MMIMLVDDDDDHDHDEVADDDHDDAEGSRTGPYAVRSDLEHQVNEEGGPSFARARCLDVFGCNMTQLNAKFKRGWDFYIP